MKLNYASLGTSNKRAETPEDHRALSELVDSQWTKIRDFCHQSPQEIRNWQFDRIKKLVKHAYDTVPLYRNKYSKIGFKPQDLKTWEDFYKLPILKKEEVIEGFPDNTVSSQYDLTLTTRSSGSSGKFVTLAVNQQAVYIDTIQGVRQFYFQNGRDYQPQDVVLFIYTCPWWVSSVNGQYRTEFLPTTTRVEEAADYIKKLRPKIISTYPTYLYQFYEKKVPLSQMGVNLIVIHSEHSTKNFRNEMSAFFGIPVRDEFSSEELTRIALECPCGYYHLEEDACFAETMPISGFSNSGMLIGTNLLNEATPIIRYTQGDVIEFAPEKSCKCGSNFRIIKPILGRYMDSIVDYDGRIIPASCFMDLAYNWYLELGIPVHGLQYQIVQDTNGDINVYLIRGKYNLTSNQRDQIKESFYLLVSDQITIQTHLVEEFPIQIGTKFRPVISLKNKKVVTYE